jgi:hypothetical protein
MTALEKELKKMSVHATCKKGRSGKKVENPF